MMIPMTQASMGTGITQGLDPMMEQQQSLEALDSMATGIEGLFEQIDQSENLAEVMNALRGNEATVQERRSELAQLVGPKDAKATPESVLTIVQPTMEILAQTQAASPPGGIADVEITEIQAPGMQEATMRIQGGEVPVNFNKGGINNIINYNDPSQDNFDVATDLIKFYENPQLMVTDRLPITYDSPIGSDQSDILERIKNQPDQIKKQAIADERRRQADLLQQNQMLVGPMYAKPATAITYDSSVNQNIDPTLFNAMTMNMSNVDGSGITGTNDDKEIINEEASTSDGSVASLTGTEKTSPGFSDFLATQSTIPFKKLTAEEITTAKNALQGQFTGPDASLFPTNVENIKNKRLELLEGYLKKPREMSEIQKELESIMPIETGEQSSLALAKYFGQVAQTPGSLLQALVAPAGELSADLSKIKAAKTERERELAIKSFDIAQQEKATSEAQKLSIVNQAITDSTNNAKSLSEAQRDFKNRMTESGISIAKDNINLVNQEINNKYVAARQQAIQDPLYYGRVDPTGVTTQVFSVFKTGDGLKIFENGKLVDLPKDLVPLTDKGLDSILAKTGQAGALDITDSTPKNYMIPVQPSKKNVLGYIGVQGGITKQGFPFYIPAGSNQPVRLPPGYLVGDVEDNFETYTDDKGITTVIDRNNPSRTFVVGKEIVTLNEKGQVETIDKQFAAPLGELELKLPKDPDRIPEKDEIILEGNPLVYVDKNESAKVIKGGLALQGSPQEYMNAKKELDEAITLANKAKAVRDEIANIYGWDRVFGDIGNTLSAFLGDSSMKDFFQNPQYARAVNTWNEFEKAFIQQKLISDRGATWEQQFLKDWINSDRDWENENIRLAVVNDIYTKAVNEANKLHSQITGNQSVKQVTRIPSGNNKDPIFYNTKKGTPQRRIIEYLMTKEGQKLIKARELQETPMKMAVLDINWNDLDAKGNKKFPSLYGKKGQENAYYNNNMLQRYAIVTLNPKAEKKGL